MPNAPEGEFNPEHVPPFPVLTLHLDEDAGKIALDGAPIASTPDLSTREAGIEAVQRQLHARQLEAVRVRVTTPGEDAWTMVVTADGEVYDTTPAEEAKTPRAVSRRRFLVGGGALAALAAGGVAAIKFLPDLLSDSEPAAWVPPGEGEQIPVAMPPGFQRRAQWAVPVGRQSQLCLLSTGHVGTVSEEGVLTLRHPETGESQWSGADAPDSIHQAQRTNWAGQDVLALPNQSSLLLWPLVSSAVPVEPRSKKLAQDHRAETRGPRPFIELTQWIVELPAPDLRTRRLTIPAGTRAALHDASGMLHAIGPKKVHHITEKGKDVAQHDLNMKRSPREAPDGVWALTDDLVLVSWLGERGRSRLAVIRPERGQVLLDASVEDRIDQRSKVLFLGSDSLSVSRTIIHFGAEPFMRSDLDGFTPTSAWGATVYGTHERKPATLNISNPDSTPKRWQGFREDDPPPELVTERAAYVITQRLDQRLAFSAARA